MLPLIKLGNDPALLAELDAEKPQPLGSGDAVLAALDAADAFVLDREELDAFAAYQSSLSDDGFSAATIPNLRSEGFSQEETKPRALLAGAAISVLVHGVVVAALVSITVLAPDSFKVPLELVEVTLIPAEIDSVALVEEPSLAPEDVEETPEQEANATEEIPLEEIALDENAEPLPEAEIEPEAIEAIVEAAAEAIEPAPLIPIEVPAIDLVEQNERDESNEPSENDLDVLLPSLFSLQRSIDQVSSEQRRQQRAGVRRDCNILEQDDQLIDCEVSDNRNYRAAASNEVYRDLNPVREISRSRRTLRTVTGQTAALAERLEASDIPEGLTDYVLTELEASWELYTNSGNRQLQDQKRATTTWDPVQRSVNRVMSDPNNGAYYKEKAERNVHAPD